MIQTARRARILVVDDEERNRRFMTALLEAEGHESIEVADGATAITQAMMTVPDAILLDVMMPGMDGYEVARRLKGGLGTRSIPIIMVTALDDRESRVKGLKAGAEDFLTKPVDRVELSVRLRNLLRLKALNDQLMDHNRALDERVKKRTGQLVQSYRDTISALTRAAAWKDEGRGAHIARISEFALEIALALGTDAHFRDILRYASPMHDIGKLAVPDHVIGKPGALDAEEWEVMKTHATAGADMLSGIDSPYLIMGTEIARWHHENWDGGGYPEGIAGESIPLAARIVKVCDQYDALRSSRVYKPALTHERAFEIITVGDGRSMPGHFDPQVLAAFTGAAGRLREIYEATAGG